MKRFYITKLAIYCMSCGINCPKCKAERTIVEVRNGENTQGFWCLHCDSKWTTDASFSRVTKWIKNNWKEL